MLRLLGADAADVVSSEEEKLLEMKREMLAYYRVNHFNQALEAFHRSSLRIPLR